MAYKQHNSPFTGYSDPKRTTSNFDVTKLRSMPEVTVGEEEKAEGESDGMEDDSVDGQNEVATGTDDIQDAIDQNTKTDIADGRTGALQEQINDKSNSPRKINRLKNRLDKVEQANKRIEETGEIKNARKSLARETRNEKKRVKQNERQQRILDRQFRKGKITEDQLPGFEEYEDESLSIKPGEEFTVFSGGPKMYNKRNMKQINSRGTGFPHIDGDGADNTEETLGFQGFNALANRQKNRAARSPKSGALINNPVNPNDPSVVSAQQDRQEGLMSNIASDTGTLNSETPVPNELSTNDNAAAEIAHAQSTLGEATNTIGKPDPNTMGQLS